MWDSFTPWYLAVYCITTSLCYCVTASPHYHVTAWLHQILKLSILPLWILVHQFQYNQIKILLYIFSVIYVHSHWLSIVANSTNLHLFKFLLVNPWIIWLAPTTVLPCLCITMSPHHCITTLPHHCITASLCDIFPTILVWIIWLAPTTTLSHHRVTTSQHDIFPTTLVWIIWLAPSTALPHYCITMLPHEILPTIFLWIIWLALSTMLLHHCITTWDFPHHISMNHLTCPFHYITMSLREIFTTTSVWIWLVNAIQHSCDWLIVPTTANQIISI